MEKSQLEQFDMMQNVENLFNDTPVPWTGNVPVATAKTGLSSRIAAIAGQYAIQLINTTGIAENKQTVRTKLEKEAFRVSNAVRSYANSINDQNLFNKCKMSKSMLSDLHADTLTGIVFDLIVEANIVITNLATHNVTPATMTAFAASLNAFSGVKKDPQKAIDTRKEATSTIAELLPEGMLFMERSMDTSMVSLETTQATFYGIYQNSRAIHDSPTTTNSLTTLCVDSVTNAPIDKVVLTVVSNNEKRKSGVSGFNIFKNLPEGDDELQVEQPDYIPQTVDYTLVNGITKELIIELVKK